MVTGVGADAIKFPGNSAADTGVGILDAVATLSVGAAALVLAKAVGDIPN